MRGGSGVKVAGVWTPNTDPRVEITAVPDAFTHHTPVSPASEPDRRWYRTRTGLPVRTDLLAVKASDGLADDVREHGDRLADARVREIAVADLET